MSFSILNTKKNKTQLLKQGEEEEKEINFKEGGVPKLTDTNEELD